MEKRTRWRQFGGALGLAVAALMLATFVDGGPNVNAGDIVIASTNTDFIVSETMSVEEKLDSLSHLPPSIRQTAMLRLTPEQESTLWRAHTHRWLTAGSGLNDEQRAFMLRAYEFQSPETYRRTEATRQAAAQLCKDAARAFPDENLKFATMLLIGHRPGQPVRRFVPPKKGFFERLLALAESPIHARDVKCNCDTENCPCKKMVGCQCDGGECVDVNHNCGCSGAGDCNNYCVCCGCG